VNTEFLPKDCRLRGLLRGNFELHSAEVSLSPKIAFIAFHTSSRLFLSILVSSRAPTTLSEPTSLINLYLTKGTNYETRHC